MYTFTSDSTTHRNNRCLQPNCQHTALAGFARLAQQHWHTDQTNPQATQHTELDNQTSTHSLNCPVHTAPPDRHTIPRHTRPPMAPSQIWHAVPHCLVHSHATRTWYYYPTQLISKPHRQNITRTLQPTGYHRRASDGSSRGTCQPDKCCAFMLLQTGQQKLAVPASRLHADCTAGTAKLHMRYPCVLGTPALPCSQLPA